jgi:hypothetical protein
MADILILKRRLSVGTVDSFQGQERGISAITLTRSNPQGEIGFLSDIRRMNVGMTRARRKLLLVGDSSTLCRHPFFGELLEYVKGVGGATGRQLRWSNRSEGSQTDWLVEVRLDIRCLKYFKKFTSNDVFLKYFKQMSCRTLADV